MTDQEKRIKDLERRVAGPGAPAVDDRVSAADMGSRLPARAVADASPTRSGLPIRVLFDMPSEKMPADFSRCPGRTDGAYQITAECRDCLRREPPRRPGPVSWMAPREESCESRLKPEDLDG